MALPAFDLASLVPAYSDDFESYAVGARLGVDAGIGTWNSGGLLTFRSNHVFQPSPSSTGAMSVHEGGVSEYVVPADYSINHWVASQCIVPMSGVGFYAPGTFPGARVNRASQSGYFVLNQGSEPMVWTLIRLNGGVATSLASFVEPMPGSTNNGIIDGYEYDDGVFAILEVAGSTPVTLRWSIACCVKGPAPFATSRVTPFPGSVPSGTSGQPAVRVIGTVEDSSPARIAAGNRPGYWCPQSDQNGAVLNFNTGEIPILSAIADPVVGGTTTVRVARPPGTTVTVTEI